MYDSGFIYALINVSMNGLVKVGKTTRDPQGRADELSGATGVPTPFILAYSTPFLNCSEAEQLIHTILETRCERVSENREFFKAELNKVIETILEVKKIDYDSDRFPLNTPSIEYLASDDETKSIYEPNRSIWQNHFELAENSYYGIGDTLRDYEEALGHYRQAAKLGASNAFFNIGQMYKCGEGCIQDLNTSLKYFKQGALKKDHRCYAEMAAIYYEKGNIENAIKCWDKYMDEGNHLIYQDNNDFINKAKYLFHYTKLNISEHNSYPIFKLKDDLSKLDDDIKFQLNKAIQNHANQFIMKEDNFNLEAHFSLIKPIPAFRSLIIKYKDLDKDLRELDLINEFLFHRHVSELADIGIVTEAISLLLQAIDSGSKFAYQKLAEIYCNENGKYKRYGLERDLDKAIRYLLSGAIAMKNGFCYWDIGEIYYKHLENYEEALEYWFRYFTSNTYKNDERGVYNSRSSCVFDFVRNCIWNKDKASLKKFISLTRSLPRKEIHLIKSQAIKLIDAMIRELDRTLSKAGEMDHVDFEKLTSNFLYEDIKDEKISSYHEFICREIRCNNKIKVLIEMI